jgi:lipopolysaccharide/colanic/teichoic acid biosynthesis glycosyltransferase
MSASFFHSIKRLVDICGGLLGMTALAPLIGVVALGNTLFSPGPLFFRQRRVGKGGEPFNIIKFRSMIPDAERDVGAVWASPNDARVTPGGKILRRTHLDELPQVINVLRGEMSLVGPRPERPEFVDQLSSVIQSFGDRHVVRPGITGWAQVQQDHSSSVETAREKLEYDLHYVRHAGMRLDTVIALYTLLQGLGLRRSSRLASETPALIARDDGWVSDSRQGFPAPNRVAGESRCRALDDDGEQMRSR